MPPPDLQDCAGVVTKPPRQHIQSSIVQDTVVVRGEEPMAPGEVVALVPPPRPESAVDADAPDAVQDQGPSEPA